MTHRQRLIIFSLALLLCGAGAGSVLAKPPRVFLIDAGRLEKTRQNVRTGDRSLTAAIDRLESDARKALQAQPFSVVTKTTTPPSGDKHDYMSQAPYFWPDPAKPDGLPYIRRDGERNPEINKISDHESMDRMVASVGTLALAYYLKTDEAYARQARLLLRAWFLDRETRMNPNLQYAQAIPGITTGRGIGLIETRGLTRVVDAVGLLAGSQAWTNADQRDLEKWFAEFLQWMRESKNGRDEAAAKNNHGTYYDLQVVSFALFTGERDYARRILEEAKEKRIAIQIEPDGRQPLELARTRSWSYSVGNLDGLTMLAVLGEVAGVDLWGYQTADGRCIRGALEYLTPFALSEEKWSHAQITEFSPESLLPVLRRARARYKDEKFRLMMSRLPAADPATRAQLTG